MPDAEGIVAVGLLTERDLIVLGQALSRSYPIEDHRKFDELRRRIEAAEHGPVYRGVG